MKTARDLILELYKEDHITKGETHLLLDAITVSKPVQLLMLIGLIDLTKLCYPQPNWTITNNTDTNNVE